MTEGEFLKEWVNNVANEYNEKDYHEYSEREVLDMLRKWKEQLKQRIEDDFKKWQEENNFVYIVEDHKGRYDSFLSTREKAQERIDYIQDSYKKPLVINCQKVY